MKELRNVGLVPEGVPMPVSKFLVTDELSTRAHFAMIPNELHYAEISINARAIWSYVASEGEGWQSSIANIGRNLNIHRNTVSRGIQELIECKMLSTRTTEKGTDFSLHPPSAWIVRFRSMPSHLIRARDAHQKCESPHPKSAGLALPQGGIQEDKNPNTSKTTERKRSRVEVREDIELQDGKHIPNLNDWWYLHFLKSSIIENYFLTLSEVEQKRVRDQYSEPELNDDFVSDMHLRINQADDCTVDLALI
jgi:hypothetical protein